MSTTPKKILQEYWGYPDFRPMQEEIIQSVMDGKDTLALLPTGGGKSICFQVPALAMDGICIVVSPLIALMKDQVYNLQRRNISATAIYSGMHYRDIDRMFDNCVYGNVKLLYLSPERLMTDLAIERIKRMNVNLLAIDEAHCISQWGYDFRPPYLQIAEIRKLIPNTPVMALTATATQDVVVDIQEKLEFKEKNVFQKSFERENLSYVVLNEENKEVKMLDIIKKVKGTGIVYVRNRKKTKLIAQYLQRNNIAADFYHAGLTTDERSQKQDDWVNNKTRIIVSTNAFGMGIDKPDVRIVVHMEAPDSLEAYFQEAGRGGRDGKKAYAVLLYNPNDRLNLEGQYEAAFPSPEEIRQTYRALGSYFQLAVGGGIGDSFDFDLIEFAKTYKLDIMKTFNCLKILEQGGWIVLSEAVFVPSSIKVSVSKDEMYDYLLRNQRFDLIIKTILRSYQGAFNNFVNINERKLASFLKISAAELFHALKIIQQDGIVDYRPMKDKPQIFFLQERIDANNLTIDTKLYEFRKKRHLERITKVMAYAEEERCRSRQLLYYFGETETKICGVCDVCLGRNKSDISTEEFARYKDKILYLLKRESLTLEAVVDSFAAKRKAKVLKAIEFMLDEGIINQEDGKLTL